MRIHAGYNLHRRKKWQGRTHGMTREEIHRDYQIPLSVIKAYDEWGCFPEAKPRNTARKTSGG